MQTHSEAEGLMKIHSVIGPATCGRMKALLDHAQKCKALQGAGAEVGVFRGGSLVEIAKVLQDKTIYGIDTFTGEPESLPWEHHKKGDFGNTDYVFLKEYFKENHPNVKLIKGRFPTELVLKKILSSKFCFVHIDVDLYRSTKDCLEYFVPKLVQNGVLIMDDYAFESTKGAQKATIEFVKELNKKDFQHDMIPGGSYYIKRIGAISGGSNLQTKTNTS